MNRYAFRDWMIDNAGDMAKESMNEDEIKDNNEDDIVDGEEFHSLLFNLSKEKDKIRKNKE